MKEYNWRNNVILTNDSFRARIAVKVENTSWLKTERSAIVLISIYSRFHMSKFGSLKMQALMQTIKSHVTGKITVLLSDQAHLHTHSLSFGGNLEKAFADSLATAQLLVSTYSEHFADCQIAFWHTFIGQDPYYNEALALMHTLYKEDEDFRKMVLLDAHASYTPFRESEYPNEHIYLKKVKIDLLEQCACLLVTAKKGYHYTFYPGKPNSSFSYVKNKLLIQHEWINVYLGIEKATHTSIL